MNKILITGAGGYIGSIATEMFLKQNFEVIAVDNFSRGFRQPLQNLKTKHPSSKFRFYEADLRFNLKETLANEKNIDAVIHYAAFCNVGESETNPGLYFDNNVQATLKLLDYMKIKKISKIIFSSTCSVYGKPKEDLISEEHIVDPSYHPYAESKYISERIIDWYSRVYGIKYIILRYFNVCGATVDGQLGDSKKPSFHLVQNAVRGALGLAKFQLTYTPVKTKDGSPIRDYVNVIDLNQAHIEAFNYLKKYNTCGVFNLGTGIGYSVLEILKLVEEITHKKIKVSEAARRKTDVPQAVASNYKINKLMGWKPVYSLKDSILQFMNWYGSHPQGWSK